MLCAGFSLCPPLILYTPVDWHDAIYIYIYIYIYMYIYIYIFNICKYMYMSMCHFIEASKYERGATLEKRVQHSPGRL